MCTKRFRRLLFGVFIVGVLATLVAVGCGTPDEPEGSGDHPKLPCERRDYPCSFSDVDASVNRRTVKLTLGAHTRGGTGENWRDALDWLRDQPEIAEARGSASGIRFRLEGGRPAWVYFRTTPMYAKDSTPSSAPNQLRTTDTDRSRLVAGNDRTPREPKKALVVTPESAGAGVSDKVAETLRTTRGYRGQGAVRRRPMGGAEPELEDFKNWGNYDVVFLTTHGVCSGDECEEVSFSTGVRIVDRDFNYYAGRWKREGDQCVDVDLTDGQKRANREYEEAVDRITEQLTQRSEKGLTYAAIWKDCELRDSQNPGTENRYCKAHLTYAVEPAFFEAYAGDTEGTLVVANGCESFSKGATPFAETFGGDESAFVGWSSTVTSSDDNPVMPELFELLQRGLPAWSAIEQLTERNLHLAPELSRAVKEKYCLTDQEQPRLRHSSGEDVVRIREVVSLHGAEGTERLQDGTNVTGLIDGIAGDGKDDALEALLFVHGIDFGTDGSDNASEFRVQLEWNGEEVGPSYRLDKVASTTTAYRDTYQVHLEDVPLGTDVKPGGSHRLAAVVELPEGGTSRDEAEGLVVRSCWASFSAGPIGWDARAAGMERRFGSISLTDDSLIVTITPYSGDPPLRFVADSDQPWMGPGDYEAKLHAAEQEQVLTSRKEHPGTIHVDELVGEPERRLMRGTINGTVRDASSSGSSKSFPAQARFSLPVTRLTSNGGQPGITSPGLWNACGSSAVSDE